MTNTTSEKTDFIQRRLFVDLCHRYLRNNCVLAESRRSHEVKEGLSFASESGRAVRHHTLALSGPDFAAKVGFWAFTEFAFTALRDV